MAAVENCTIIADCFQGILDRYRRNVILVNDLLKRETEYCDWLLSLTNENRTVIFDSEYDRLDFYDHRLDTSEELCYLTESMSNISTYEFEILKAVSFNICDDFKKERDSLMKAFDAGREAVREQIHRFSVNGGDSND